MEHRPNAVLPNGSVISLFFFLKKMKCHVLLKNFMTCFDDWLAPGASPIEDSMRRLHQLLQLCEKLGVETAPAEAGTEDYQLADLGMILLVVTLDTIQTKMHTKLHITIRKSYTSNCWIDRIVVNLWC